MALTAIAPIRKSTPTASLEILYDVMPLHLFIQEQALKSAVRLKISPDWIPTGTLGHHHRLFNALPAELQNIDIDNVTTSANWEQNYTVIIGKGNDIEPRDWTCYSDGSKEGIVAGAGGVILKDGREMQRVAFSMGQSTVYQSEVSAITAVAKSLVVKGLKECKIDILSDSQAALRSLDNPTSVSDNVRNAKRILNVLGAENDLILHYIRAHRGFKYNEIADKCANDGRGLDPDPDNIPKLSLCEVKRKIEEITTKRWQEAWDKTDEYRQTRYFIPGPSKGLTRKLLTLGRDKLGQMVRFLTGHAFLRRQNAIVFHDMNPPPGDVSCRLCEDTEMDETPHHIITECGRLCQWRASILGQYSLDDCPNWEPITLSKFLRHKLIILLETDEE